MKASEFDSVDPVMERIKTLEMRVKQLEKTIERMDGILCAMKHHEHREPRFG